MEPMKRSREISHLNSPCRIRTGDLSTQSLNSADTSLAIPTCSPTRDDRAAGGARGNTFPPYTRHPERQRRISVNTVSEGKGSQYQWAGRSVPGPGMTNTESFTAGTEILRLRLRMTGGAGRKHMLILAVSCPAVNSRGALKSPRNGARGIPPPLSFRRSAAEPRNLSSNGTRRNEAGDLGAQSLNSADTSLAIPACTPARDDRAAGSVKHKAFPPYTRHPERQRRISVNTVSEGKGSQYQWAGRRVTGPGMTGSRGIHGMYRDSSPAAQNDRRGGKEDFRRAYHAKKR